MKKEYYVVWDLIRMNVCGINQLFVQYVSLDGICCNMSDILPVMGSVVISITITNNIKTKTIFWFKVSWLDIPVLRYRPDKVVGVG